MIERYIGASKDIFKDVQGNLVKYVDYKRIENEMKNTQMLLDTAEEYIFELEIENEKLKKQKEEYKYKYTELLRLSTT